MALSRGGTRGHHRAAARFSLVGFVRRVRCGRGVRRHLRPRAPAPRDQHKIGTEPAQRSVASHRRPARRSGTLSGGEPTLSTNVENLQLEQSGADGWLLTRGPVRGPALRFETPSHAATSLNRARRRDQSAVIAQQRSAVGDVRVKPPSAERWELPEFGDVDTALDTVCLPRYELKLPAREVLAMRLDPSNRESEILISGLELCRAGAVIYSLPLLQVETSRHSAQTSILVASESHVLLRAAGRDPWFVLPGLPAFDGVQSDLEIRLDMVVSAGTQAEIFIDSGAGSESEKLAIPLRPSLLGSIVGDRAKRSLLDTYRAQDGALDPDRSVDD